MVILLTAISRQFNLSTPIAMVLGGLALSFVPAVPEFELSPDVVFFGFLPPLVFSGGYLTSVRELKKNVRPIFLLAVGLVLFTAGVVAVVTRTFVPEIGWPGAFALGGIVAPPDEIAATAVFQRLGVPRRIVAVLEGESLLNDATALVIYRFAVAAAAAAAFSLFDASLEFFVILTGGILVGALGGLVTELLARRVSDTPLAVAMTLVAPYAVYLPAEGIGATGVIAGVTAGVLARHAMRHTSSDTRVVTDAVWQIWLFLLNGLVFLLLGLQLRAVLREARPDAGMVAAAAVIVAAVVLTRFIWVFPATYLPRLIPAVQRADPAPPWRAVVVVGWSGLRGVVSLAAALALPLDFPARDLILFFTFAVILATLVGQGLTLPLLIRALGVVRRGDATHSITHARALTAEAALRRVDELEDEWPAHKPLIETLRSQYEHRTSHADESHHEPGEAEQEIVEHSQIRRELIEAERRAALDLHGRGVIDDEVLRALERDLDLEEVRMEA